MAKFVFIGIGSTVFGAKTIGDLFEFKEELAGSTVSLVDIDGGILDLMTKFAEKMNERSGCPFQIESSFNRRDVLPGSDFVIASPAVKREELWKQDWDIARKAGSKQTYGENGGPGALLLTLRNVPLILDICRDMEELAPDAWIINFTNPESRICMAIDRYTSLKFVGLCHQIRAGYDLVSRVLNIPPEDLDIKAAGLNHSTWMYTIHHSRTAADLYPAFREKLQRSSVQEEAPLSCKMYDLCGLFPSSGDAHLAEMFSFGWEFQGLGGRDFTFRANKKAESLAWLKGVVSGTRAVDEVITGLSEERVVPMATAMLGNKNSYEISVNFKNNGAIPNLPPDAIVEAPALISAFGVTPLQMAPLPKVLEGFLSLQIRIQELSVEAAVTGSRQIASQALLLDPVVDSVMQSEKLLDELLEVNRPYIAAEFFT